MSDIFTPEKRSAIMKAVKSRNTKSTELKMIEIFKELHIIVSSVVFVLRLFTAFITAERFSDVKISLISVNLFKIFSN